MKKPVTGIVPLVDVERESYWMLPGYMEGIAQAGGLPLMLPLTDDAADLDQIVTMCDGFLFTGGHDVSPELYGEEKLPECAGCCPERDRMETELLKKVLDADRPVLGICRGIQFLNAALGGTLYQDLPTQHPSALTHRQQAPYDVPAHDVTIRTDSPLYRLLRLETLSVNSCHHQAIRALSPKLTAMASAADGLTEAVYMPGKRFVWAVQWHPEFSWRVDAQSRKIFRAFVDAQR